MLANWLLILYMLLLKSEQQEAKITISSVRKNYYRIIRRNQIEAIFQTIRKNAFEAQSQIIVNNRHDIALNGQMPMNYQQMYSNYVRYLSYVARFTQPLIPMPVLQNNVKDDKREPPKMIIAQIKPSIYFQKNGFVVYRNLIGKGSYSQVWQGTHVLTGEKVAVKEVKQLEQNEVKCLSELASPYIVKVLSIFKHKGKTYIVLQFCQKNLRDELIDCREGCEQILIYFEQIVAGMDVLQSRNILHRDLKFQNILVKDKSIKIADFGLAKFLGSELEVCSRRCGTPYTMAPEIYFSDAFRTPYTIKCDIWSIGVILHEMLYKKHPFKGNRQAFKRQQRCRVQRKFGILDQLIDECLNFNPSNRIGWEQFKQIFLEYLKIKNGQSRAISVNMQLNKSPTINKASKFQNLQVEIDKLQSSIQPNIINFNKVKHQPKNKTKKQQKEIINYAIQKTHYKLNPLKKIDQIKSQKKNKINTQKQSKRQVESTVVKNVSRKPETSKNSKPIQQSVSNHQNMITVMQSNNKQTLKMSKLRLIIQFLCIASVVSFFLCIF